MGIHVDGWNTAPATAAHVEPAAADAHHPIHSTAWHSIDPQKQIPKQTGVPRQVVRPLLRLRVHPLHGDGRAPQHPLRAVRLQRVYMYSLYVCVHTYYNPPPPAWAPTTITPPLHTDDQPDMLRWFAEVFLRERDWGQMDLMSWAERQASA